MSDWLEHSVEVEVAVPVELAWNLWSDLELMPLWMKWIESVELNPEDPSLSRWKLASNGLEFSWNSRIVKLVPHQIIQWESVDGLPNRGAIRFYDRSGGTCIVRLSVSYAVPGILKKIIDGPFLRKIVDSSLLGDLERFRQYAIEHKS
jgi:uncharacterized membrane protein